MLTSKRKNEPAHYMLKIESFSLLSEAITTKVESDVFEAGGHNWRLDLYPNGNEEEDAGDHISLYVIICDDIGSCSKGWEVCVDVNVFIYDHLQHNYVAFQDVDGNRTVFHERKMEWGFHKLISLESFKDDKNGYLLNDSCVFGAEIVAVPRYSQKDRCLTMIKLPSTISTHTWTINKFSDLINEVLYSEVFKVGKVKWKLSLYPKGLNSGKGSHLSIFLVVHDAALYPDGWRVYAKFKLRVKSQNGGSDDEKETSKWFLSLESDWGFSSFMRLSELSDEGKGFLLNNNLIVEAEISFVGMLRNFI